MMSYSCLCTVFLFLAALLTLPVNSQNSCPISQANLANYIENDRNVFSTQVQAQFDGVPGSPLGGARITWSLTYPQCVDSVCVIFSNRQEQRVGGGYKCVDDVAATEKMVEDLPCNTYVRAEVVLTAGVHRRSQFSNEIYIGGNLSLAPTTPPPNLRAYLNNSEVVFTWDEIECEHQNSPIQYYIVSAGVVGQGTTTFFEFERIVRSSQTLMPGRLHINDLSQLYQFTVIASSNSGFSPRTPPLQVVPANLGPIPISPPPTTQPPTTQPPTTLPPTTQPPTTFLPTTLPPPVTTPPPTTLPPIQPPLSTAPSMPSMTMRPTTMKPGTTPSRQTTPITTEYVNTTTNNTKESETTTVVFSGSDTTNSTSEMPSNQPAVGAVIGVLAIITLILLILSGIILGWLMWRHRSKLRSRKRLSISGPIAVNDLFMEIRDSQLLEAETQEYSKEKVKQTDKNIYDELKATEPKIKDYKRQIHIGEGEQVSLQVAYTGFPKPSIDWFYNGMRLDANSLNGREMLNDGSIYIKAASEKHAGTYDFIVSNSLGSVEGCTKLIVYVEEREYRTLTLDRKKKNGSKLESHFVKKEKFADHVSHCHTFNNKGFNAEFQSLMSGEDKMQVTVGRTGENRFKNRFKNIMPYDRNRLTLDPINHPECQYDYINASYIDGYVKPKRYIAAQGPTASTILDFWRMIWQEKVQTIAMVTNTNEGRQKICEQYWPTTGSAEYGPFMVTLVETQAFADYTIRTFQLLTNELIGKVRNIRKIIQYQFLSWPDHGIPDYPGPLLSYLYRVKSLHKPTKGPILVHCSAGVGRTGTLIAIDIALAQAARENVIDIAGIVCKIRTQRMKMVQTPEQYAFIHDAVQEGITCGETQIPASGFKKAVSKMANRDTDTGLNSYEKQFETLEKVSPHERDMPRTVALRCPEKNRSDEFLPPDISRVWLKAQNMDKTYVHASYINGYKQKNAFIITQAPLESTMEDFWRMVYETDCAVIIMLSGLEELGEEFCYKYWPDSQAKAAINGEKHGAHTVFTLERKRLEGFLVRTFGITDPKGENIRKVTQYQMAGWSQDGVCINPVAMMKLIDKLMITQRRTGNKPILVHGSNTVSRCAVFCALLNCIDSCKCESIVDVFQIVKALRLQKPGAIQNVEQYCNVYDLVVHYLNSFTLYSNFK